MRVTTIDHYRPAAGQLVIFSPDASAADTRRSGVPPSFNQSIHLAGADGSSIWLAAAFDICGPIDTTALARAYRDLIARHGTLHSSFHREGTEVVRHEVDPAGITVTARAPITADTDAELQALLRAELDSACAPLGFPAYLLAAITRDEESTIICGFDHAHVDAYSISIVIDDLHRLYHGHHQRPGEFCPNELPMSGSFVDFCAAESQTPAVAPGDPRMRDWLRFFDSLDATLPTFPLDLGLQPGQSARQASDLRPLLDAADTERCAQFCRANGASLFGGILAAMADAIRSNGGGPELATLFPMHTRRAEPWQNAVGWFTTNAPIQIVSTGDPVETMRRAGPTLRRAMRLGEVPVPQVISTLGGFTQLRSDIFMISYVDYRRLPTARLGEGVNAHHISNATTADDAQFWISRSEQGLAIRTRHPDTATARASINGFLTTLAELLTAHLLAPVEPAHPTAMAQKSAVPRSSVHAPSPALADDGRVAAP